MTFQSYLQLGFYLAALLLLAKPLGAYMARVFEGRPTGLDRALRPLERLLYRLSRVRTEEMGWQAYASAMLIFNLLGFAAVYLLLRLNRVLPLNPQHFGPVEPHTALNIAISFATNTNWQNYSPEMTLGYLPQMLGLAVQNFLSAATGGHPGRGRAWLCPPHGTKRRQLLGRSGAHDALHPAAAVDPRGTHACLPGRDPELQSLSDDHDAGRRSADDRHGAGGITDCHQAAWDERWGLL